MYIYVQSEGCCIILCYSHLFLVYFVLLIAYSEGKVYRN